MTAADHDGDSGLLREEYERVLGILGRKPNQTELGIFASMWSEHCSYKSSRVWLRKLPTEAPWVLQGPGENAGVIDIGEGWACVFKMESHNHPSFIEPRQGAATGVGGILRDVFTMGARPVASVNALRFGNPDHPRTRHLVRGVVEGIGGYGNCVGVPTVGGEVNFDPGYDGNILVNAMTVGLARRDRIFLSAAAGVGNPVVYVGAKTGRDGIEGATMASAGFDGDENDKRPTVQVGDPFTGKLLLEACLELMATDAIIAIQDMGAAGLTSSSVEMSDRGGVGLEMDLDRVPVREDGMTPREIMLSESQERMLMVLAPGREEQARAVFEKWGVDFAVIGTVIAERRLVLRKAGDIVADIPVPPLVAEAPVLEREVCYPGSRPPLSSDYNPDRDAGDVMQVLRRMISSPDLCSRRWIWEQYDSTVMGDTAQGPGADAAVVRIHGSNRGLAITSDCTPRYCAADPFAGGRQAVAEAWRNLTACGALPLAVTDNLNFGNPERPRVMGQFAGCIRGMAEACRALEFPVVSGNVSFYNETAGIDCPPTPVIGGVGLIDDLGSGMARGALDAEGLELIVIGDSRGHLGCSLFLRLWEGRDSGPPPDVDLAAERRNGELVRSLIREGVVRICHDVSDGGLLITLSEMAMAGGFGLNLTVPVLEVPVISWLFGEDQGRYVVAVRDGEAVLAASAAAGVSASRVGTSGGTLLAIEGLGAVAVDELKDLHEAWFPAMMEDRPAR